MNEAIIRWPSLKSRVGLSRVTLWRMERAGKFPSRVRLGENSVGWRLDEVEEWLAERPRVGRRNAEVA
jgi:prophage regulatory protein